MTSFTTPPNITASQSLGGNDTGTVASGSSVTVSSGTAVSVTLATANPSPYTGVQITNSGTIQDTNADGRAINASGTPTGVRTLKVVNNSGATITSTDDTIRVNSDLVAGSTVTVDNSGTISSTATGGNGGQGIDFNAIATVGSTVTITNRASGVITAADNDAVRPGQNGDVENSGQITSNAVATPTSQPSADGIDFQDNHTGTVHNFATGTISGARHGIAGGTNTTVTVTADAGSSITGRDGSGVGLDGSGTVVNRGTITGTIDATSARGDGDGVDIDLTGNVTNFGTIQGLGAKGNDSGGRTNAGEGLSLGGGTVANYGSILSSATNPDGVTANTGGAIVVNDDAYANRSGNASTTITNFAGASITGGNAYAIRLENKGSDAVDTDQITNYGTITGHGAIPDPNGTVTYVAPAGQANAGQTVADPNSVGTLDGVAYTGTGSARFIRGDGSAIQMGEGADILTDYGTITGTTGRAVNLEGGDDTLNLYTGSSISGRLDGGAGTDTLNLRLDDRTGTDASLGSNSGVTAGTLSNVIDIERLNVQGGAWTIADDQAYSGGVTISAGASLQVGDGAVAGSLAGTIADAGSLTFRRDDASTYAGMLTGAGTLSKSGAGALALTGDNSGFSGSVSLDAGTLELGQTTSAGTGAVTFSTGAQTLRLDMAGTYANPITGFSTEGDVIDLQAVDPATATASYDGTRLTVSDGTNSVTLTINAAPSGYRYSSRADATAGTDVTLTAITAPTITAPSNGTDTNDSRPTISGTGESGDTVVLSVSSSTGMSFTAQAMVTNGTWSVTPGTALPDGTYTATAAETSPSGTGTSATSDAETFSVDATPPVVSSPTVTVMQNSGATPIGIAAPSDGSTAAGSLSIVAGRLPTDGVVTLGDGTTPVTTGERLTAAELQGLAFTPGAGAFNQGSTFTYTVTDGAGNATTGTAALNVGDAGAPTITGTHASTTTSEAAVAPFTGVTVADPSAAAGAIDTVTITLTGLGGTLSGTGLTANADGTYSLTGSASAVTAELDAVRFKPTAGAAGTTSTTHFVLTDTSSAGTSVADGGTSVADTSPAATPVPPDRVSLDRRVTYDRGIFTLTGSASSAAGVSGVEISAVLNDGTRQDLGAATVNADGSFTFADQIGANRQGFIEATLTDRAGVQTVSVDPGFSLTGGLDRGPFRARQTRYSADGSAVTSTSLFRPDGSQRTDVLAPGQTFTSAFFDTFDNGGAPGSTFVFDPGHGLDVVNLFWVDGTDHDTLSFKGSDFGNAIATVLQNTRDARGGAVITDPTSGDTVKLTGITKAELKAHQSDFALHA